MLKNILTALVMVSIPFVVNGVETIGSLKRLYISKDGMVLFSLHENVNDRPSCATNSMWQYAFSASDAAGKEMYSMLLAAKTAKSSIRIGHSSGSCSSLFPSTSVAYMYLTD